MKISVTETFKKQFLAWLEDQSVDYMAFDSNRYDHDQYAKYEFLVLWGLDDQITLYDPTSQDLDRLDEFITERDGKWLSGWVNYDVKNALHNLHSTNQSIMNTADVFFCQPLHILSIDKGGEVVLQSDQYDLKSILSELQLLSEDIKRNVNRLAPLEVKTSVDEYKTNIGNIKEDIENGLYYELNYCQSFHTDASSFNTLDCFLLINDQAQAPFSSLIKSKDHDVLCFSPERFFCTRDRQLVSQPIKGTIAAGLTDELSDKNGATLYQSEKDRAENVMIVDLVRNDMTKCCKPGTIEVDELFGVYPFKNVIHMISTITAELEDDVSFVDLLYALFPMGSMTGAPKLMCMEKIDHYEHIKRGLFSGTIGYIDPSGEMDFNVVIRSLFVDKLKKKLSTVVGGAIVYDSIPEEELNECYTKLRPIFEAFDS